jgi:putative tryptophan/tyrosine transport system substrate-binding protein
LELLAKAVPKLSRVGFLSSSDVLPSAPILRAAQAAAAAAGLQLVPVEARNLQDFESAFATLAKERAQALMVGMVFNAQRQRLAELSLRARLPTIGTTHEFVEAGGLMSYGESARDFNRRAAFYVDKIINGAKPADLASSRRASSSPSTARPPTPSA